MVDRHGTLKAGMQTAELLFIAGGAPADRNGI